MLICCDINSAPLHQLFMYNSREKMGYILCTSQYKLSKDMYIPLTYSHLIYI